MSKKGSAKTFTWVGKDAKGRFSRGEIQTQSTAIAKALLRKQGITATKIRKKTAGIALFNRKKPIKPLDIAVFTRQLATMVKAGVPLIQSFEITTEGTEKPLMKELILTLKNDVAGGTNLASALRKHHDQFDDLYCNLIAAGEKSGTLQTLLDRIAEYKEKTETLKAKIKKAMTYPISVVVVAIIVTAILLIKVIPQFQDVFDGFDADLPAFTLFVIMISEILQKWWWIVLGVLIGCFFLYKKAHKKHKCLRDAQDRAVLKLPIVGDILKKSAIARFTRTLSTTFAAGLPLIDALDSVAGATGNSVYYEATQQIKDEVTSGTQLQLAMRKTGIFPTLAIQMVIIGEESGTLDDMLDKVATIFEEEVDNMVDGLTSLMEPFIMSVLGFLVGGLIIAMYLPIFQLGSVV